LNLASVFDKIYDKSAHRHPHQPVKFFDTKLTGDLLQRIE
jgi:hypothetical protein